MRVSASPFSRRAAGFCWALAAISLANGPAHAARVQVHSIADFDKLAEGDALTTGIAAHGAVVLPPPILQRANLPGGPVLAVVSNGNGLLYAALATPGRVVSVDAKGTVKTLLETEEPVVTALALDGKGALYAATAPQGAVHRVDLKTGKSEKFWQPEEKYLWSLAHDGTSLWVATGDPGALYRVDAKGNATRVAEKALSDKLLRSVAVGAGGKTVVVGAGRKGILYRVDDKGNAFALHDSSLEEVTSLAVRADGAIAAALVANDAKGSGDDDLLTASEGGSETDENAPRDVKASEVVVVFPSGEVRQVWRGKKDGAYAVAFDERGDVLIGTGARGRLYRAELESRRITILAQVSSIRITAMAASPREVVLGLSHAAAVVSLQPGLLKQGTYLSPVLDGDGTVRLGRLYGRAETPAGTRINLFMRVGNTDKPDETWSPWSAAVPVTGGQVRLPRARFAQIKAVLEGDGKVGPELRELHVAYTADNSPPQIVSLEVLAPGVRVEAMPNDESKGRTFTVSARAFDDYALKPLQSPSPPEPAARAKQTYETGWRTVVWHATDEDEDELRYRAELHAEQGGAQVLLGEDLHNPFVPFEEWRLADGAYRVRLQAHDRASNPAGEGRTVEKTSLVFTVDRTPPVLKGRIEKGEAGKRLLLTVEDLSPIIRVGCSVDGADPIPASAVDGVLDGPVEEVRVSLPALPAGHHVASCLAEDALGNTGRLVVDVQVP